MADFGLVGLFVASEICGGFLDFRTNGNRIIGKKVCCTCFQTLARLVL